MSNIYMGYPTKNNKEIIVKTLYQILKKWFCCRTLLSGIFVLNVLHAFSDGERCPVKYFVKYIRRLNQKSVKLFQQARL